MHYITRPMARGVALALALALASAGAAAQWDLDPSRSRIAFVSVKNAAIGEVHHFTSLVGYVGPDGHAQLSIDLDSVETAIPIRNQRMRELLFETVSFPAANVSTRVDPAVLASGQGGSALLETALTVDLHGRQVSYNAVLVVDIDEAGNLHVSTRQPLIVNAADFALDAGVSVLREVAGLASISTAVPVTVQLLFRPAADNGSQAQHH